MKEPDIQGQVASAWLLPNPVTPEKPDHEACLAVWLVNGPFHPFWSWWMITLIHLRDLPGVMPAKKKYPKAEYEFGILSLDPASPPDPESPKKTIVPLLPPDVVEQFHGVSDADAVRICHSAIQAICAGRMSPDQDYRSSWSKLIAGTVKSFREGEHKAS